MNYDLFRGLHIISVIAWMAGMLYLPRLFVNHIVNKDKPDVVEVLSGMERRLLRFIINPSMIAAWIFGAGLIHIDIQARGAAFLLQPWFVVKIACVLLLSGFHGYLAGQFKKLSRGEDIGTEKKWRIINELPMVLAIIIVLSATLEYGV
jgi:protoporphyrinogen IX oxidase